MGSTEYLESHPEYRALFPTQEMYEDFVRFMTLDEEERRLYFEEHRAKLDTITPDYLLINRLIPIQLRILLKEGCAISLFDDKRGKAAVVGDIISAIVR